MKLDQLTNATVVDDAIRFVSEKQKEDVENQRYNEKIQQRANDDNSMKLELLTNTTIVNDKTS